MDNGGLRYGAVEGALRPPLPTATPTALHNPTFLLALRGPKIHIRLTDPLGETSSPRSAEANAGWPASNRNPGRLQIGMVAGFRSESVAGFLLELVAGFVGIRIRALRRD